MREIVCSTFRLCVLVLVPAVAVVFLTFLTYNSVILASKKGGVRNQTKDLTDNNFKA